MNAQTKGLLYGLIAVVGFSPTLPAMRIAVMDFDPIFVGLGRAFPAALLAAIILWATRQPLPTWRQLKGLLIVTVGAVIGFPYFSTLAMQDATSAHGAVVLAGLPLVTALTAVVRAGERPAPIFWFSTVAGSAAVLAFTLAQGGGWRWADLALGGAVLTAGIGYAEGGRLARELGGWQVICWALVLSVPLLIVPVGLSVVQHDVHASLSAWWSFIYLSLISQFLAFFAWYRGMALAGIARVGQLQLLQPFFTLLIAALLLGEAVTPLAMATALVVVAVIVVQRKTTVRVSEVK